MSEQDASASTPTPTASRWSDRREVVRLVAGIVVILAFVALAALAIAASRSDVSISAPALSSRPAAPPAGGAAPPVTSALRAPRLTATAPLVPAATPPAPAPASAPAPAAPSAAPEPAVGGVPCPQLGLPAPEEVGGLQSLVRLIPIFGAFSPEAFALMPAFQPGFDALGPLFPVFERGLDGAAPILDAVVPRVRLLIDAGYQLLSPLYAPVRDDVLASERALAAYLEPIVASLADAPGSECLIALEALLADL